MEEDENDWPLHPPNRADLGPAQVLMSQPDSEARTRTSSDLDSVRILC